MFQYCILVQERMGEPAAGIKLGNKRMAFFINKVAKLSN